MNIKTAILLISAALVLLSSCARYQTKYSHEADNWKTHHVDSTQKLSHSMYLIDDAGYNEEETASPVVKYLKQTLENETENSSVIFLGDNIYQSGMPPKADKQERAEAEFRIDAQLSTIDKFDGYPLFIPGNHDWRGWGRGRIKKARGIFPTLHK